MNETAVRAEGLSKVYGIGAIHGPGGFLGRVAAAARSVVARGAEAQRKQELWALRDVSFEIKKGEVFGVIGSNGSGKSTLLKILSRVTQPTSGRAVLTGRFCGLLEVGTGFHPELTGRDNVYMSGAILGMKRREIDRKLDEIVAFAEVEQFIDTPVKHYSSGMYVRLGFSVLAHMDPDILIVDEVLAVGDVRFQKKCMGKMDDVSHQGRTVILVSHDMRAITRLCKRALLLNRGQVVRDGEACDVVNHYLSLAHLKPSCEWQDSQQAPGDDMVRMRAVRIRSATGAVIDAFDIREPIAAEMEYEVLRDGTSCVVEFSFRNEEDVLLFIVLDRDPEWRGRPRPLGRYVSAAWIPGNLLAEGVVRVTAALLTEDPFRLHGKVPYAVGFRIHESGVGPTARGDFTGGWPGLLRPLLEWTTQYRPDDTDR